MAKTISGLTQCGKWHWSDKIMIQYTRQVNGKIFMFSVVTEKNRERMSREHSVARNTHVARIAESKPNASPVPRRTVIEAWRQEACQHPTKTTNQINNIKYIIAVTWRNILHLLAPSYFTPSHFVLNYVFFFFRNQSSLYGCETWSLTMIEERMLNVWEYGAEENIWA